MATDYDFVKSKPSYELGDKVMFQDEQGQYTVEGEVTAKEKDKQGIMMYRVFNLNLEDNKNAIAGFYTADELKPISSTMTSATASSPILEFFSGLQFKNLPEKVATYIRADILTDANMATLTESDEEFSLVRTELETRFPKAMAGFKEAPTRQDYLDAIAAHKTMADVSEGKERELHLQAAQALELMLD